MKKSILTGFFLSLYCMSYSLPLLAQRQMGCFDVCGTCCSNSEICCTPSWRQNFWDFKADFLYWSTDFNTISAIGVGLVTTESTADAAIHIRHPGQGWDPGLRLTAGWFNCGNWDVQGGWTYFYNSNTNKSAPFALRVNEDNLNTIGRSKFVFRYNAADIELGTTSCLTSFLRIRPLIGVHAIWTQVDSKLNLLVPLSADPNPDEIAIGINLKNRAWGVGPKIGINTLWGNCNGFSLVANVNGALVYGERDLKINAEVDIASNVDINIHLIGNSNWQLMSTVQMQAGLSYCGCVCNNNFRINALWECNVFNQVHNLLIFERSINTQGLTLSLEYLF